MKVTNSQNIFLGKNCIAMMTAPSNVTGTRFSLRWTWLWFGILFDGLVPSAAIEAAAVAFGLGQEVVGAGDSSVFAVAVAALHRVVQSRR